MVAVDIDINVLKVTMACSVVLYFKFFGTTMIQGGKRFAAGSRPPEDKQLSLSKKFKAKQTYGMEVTTNLKHAEADIRWQRIVLNDVGMFSSYSYVISNVMQQNLIIPRLVIIMNVCLSVCLHLQRAFQWVYCLHGDQCFVHTVQSSTWPALDCYFHPFQNPSHVYLCEECHAAGRVICWALTHIAITALGVNGLLGVFTM